VKLLVKLGGTLLDAVDSRHRLALQIAAARAVGHEIAVVHGGGKQMTRYLAERGIESTFVGGLRVTTPETLDAVLKIFAGSVNHELVAAINRAGVPAVGISGIDSFLVEAEQMDPSLGAVGRVTTSNPALLNLLTANGYVPVVACVAGDRQGQVYNVNADQMAVACAAAFGAAQLIFLTDVEGVLDGAKQVRPILTAAASRQDCHRRHAGETRGRAERAGRGRRTGAHRPRRGRTGAGPNPGRRRAGHPDGDRMISSLQADAFVESPAGAPRLTVRKAVMRDIAPILHLINSYASRGIMLARTEFEMSEAIRDFTVVTLDGELLGCGALHFYSPTTAEIRSLAVHEQAKTKGVGRRLVEALVAEAEQYELDAVFAFTYVVDFFNRVGFHVVERGTLPLKAWKDCVRCPKFQACDEIAVLRILRPDHWAQSEPQPWGPLMTSPTDELIRIPTAKS
jgi:acetylglutamate kinase